MRLHGEDDFYLEQFNFSQEIHDVERFMAKGVEVVTFSIIGLISNYLKPFSHLIIVCLCGYLFCALPELFFTGREKVSKTFQKQTHQKEQEKQGKSEKQIKITSRINFRT